MLDEIGETAAYCACQNGHLDCIEFLISKGLDLKAGETDLMEEAIRKGHNVIHIVESLWKHGLAITEAYLRQLHGSKNIHHNRWAMLYFLLRQLQPLQPEAGGADQEHEVSGRMFNLESYLSFGFPVMAAAFLEAGHMVGHLDNKSCALLLLTCTQHGFLAAARVLLTTAASLNEVRMYTSESHGWRALEVATCENDVALVRLLLQHGWQPNHKDIRGRTTLHLAALCGASEVVKELLGEGNVRQMDNDRNMPVQLAAYSGSIPVLELLVSSHEDVNKKNKAGDTPLGIACREGHAEAARWLLEHGSRCQIGDPSHPSPLHHSARWNHVACMNLLITSGADVDAKCAGDNTPMHAAAAAGVWKAISRLVFARLKQGRPKEVKKTVRHLLPELLAELCSSGPAANSTSFPFLLPYMHSSSKEVLSTTLLEETIRAGDDAELARALVDIDPKNAYLRMPGLWTMLHFACRYGRIRIARFLLANGAPMLAKSENGSLPLDMAKNHLNGEGLQAFVNLFRVFEATMRAVMEDDVLGELISVLGIEISEKDPGSDGEQYQYSGAEDHGEGHYGEDYEGYDWSDEDYGADENDEEDEEDEDEDGEDGEDGEDSDHDTVDERGRET